MSLVLALSVVIGGWLLFEYGSQPNPSTALQSATAPQPTETTPKPEQNSVPNHPPQSDLSMTYKCEKAGHLSYSDKPCNGSEKTVAVTTAEKKESPATGNDLERMKNAVSSMQEARIEREKQYATNKNNPSTNTDQASKIARCQWLDQAIATKDAELRQPHSAQWGDFLTGERKKLTDERYFLRC